MTKSKKPIHTIRYGRVRVSLWKNPTSKGTSTYNGKGDTSYQDEKGNWQHTDNFSVEDFLPLSKGFYELHTVAMDLRAKERAAQSQAEDEIPGDELAT